MLLQRLLEAPDSPDKQSKPVQLAQKFSPSKPQVSLGSYDSQSS